MSPAMKGDPDRSCWNWDQVNTLDGGYEREGLQQGEAKTNLEAGAEAMKEAALQHHHPQAEDNGDQTDPGTGVVLLC